MFGFMIPVRFECLERLSTTGLVTRVNPSSMYSFMVLVMTRSSESSTTHCTVIRVIPGVMLLVLPQSLSRCKRFVTYFALEILSILVTSDILVLVRTWLQHNCRHLRRDSWTMASLDLHTLLLVINLNIVVLLPHYNRCIKSNPHLPHMTVCAN